MEYGFYDTHRKLREFWPLSKDFGVQTIKLSQKWKKGEIPDTPAEFQGFLSKRFCATLERMEVPEEMCKKHTELFETTAKNPVSAIFLDLMRAPESEFFVQWLQNSMVANAVAMEPAYGFGEDLCGNFRAMPSYDPAIAMADDVGYTYIRWRDEKTSLLMQDVGKNATIVSIASGTMPEIRHFGYPAKLLSAQNIICYDKAEIDLDKYFGMANLPAGSVHQYRMDFAAALKEEYNHLESRQADIVYIKGFLSYVLPKLPDIIPAVVKLLQKPGSKFVFDLQLANWTMARNKWLFLWAQSENTNFSLIDSSDDAAGMICSIVNRNSLPVDISIESAIESAPNRHDATGVFVTLTKRA